jgi:hypothetical protein
MGEGYREIFEHCCKPLIFKFPGPAEEIMGTILQDPRKKLEQDVSIIPFDALLCTCLA